jgi:hypothetical protein
MDDARWVLAGGAVHGDEDAAGIGDNVGVGEEFVFTNKKSSASATGEATGIPWGFVVWDL